MIHPLLLDGTRNKHWQRAHQQRPEQEPSAGGA